MNWFQRKLANWKWRANHARNNLLDWWDDNAPAVYVLGIIFLILAGVFYLGKWVG